MLHTSVISVHPSTGAPTWPSDANGPAPRAANVSKVNRKRSAERCRMTTVLVRVTVVRGVLSRLTRNVVAAFITWQAVAAAAQDANPPTLRAGAIASEMRIDGVLDEPAWQAAEATDTFRQTDPEEGAPPSVRTIVRVLAGANALIVGIVCEDDPASVVSRSVARDADLDDEDHVQVVLGPFRDGRSGYAFAINPSGARHDSLIGGGDASENQDWDGIWEAAAARQPNGWSVEIRIPIQTLSFNSALREWDFNVQRRLERRLETNRWAFAARQYRVIQTSRAGLLTGLPVFDVGLGLTVRPAVSTGAGVPAPGASIDGEFQPSLDVIQRLGTNVTVSATTNTDFAETEVDTRRTNLTRFPLFFPEKRTFFLEGSDIFGFGLGVDEDALPYFSRRIGLVNGREVPILAGTKINGRAGGTSFGGLVVGTNDLTGVVEDEALMAVARIKQNVLRESWVGAIGTAGDPLGRSGSWLAGADFTYNTSRFRGDKNLLVGVWGLATGRDDLGGDRSAYGFKAAYPNDEWDIQLTGKRIGRHFDPSLGFVPRPAVYLLESSIDNETRISRGPFRQLTHEFRPSIAADLSGRWESYRVFIAPINWEFRSGDRVEFNANPTGERLVERFEIAEGVMISPGPYHWIRYRFEAGTAEKRQAFTQVTWWTGGFYDGHLDQLEWEATWNPVALLTLAISGERNVGRLPAGGFTQTLVGTRAQLNVSPDLSVSSYIQYDTESDLLGSNTRLRWTLRPQADLFIVYNHNIRSLEDRWQKDSNQLLVKLQYAFRY